MKKLVLCGKEISLDQVVEFGLRPEMKVDLCPEVLEKIEEGRRRLEAHMRETIYGVNTGFGALASEKIPGDKIERLQENLIKSHHAGAGNCMSPEMARAATLIRLHTLSSGYSGISKELALALVEYLNSGLSPCMKEYGSVGASGDLAPLASLALSLSLPELTEVFLWDGNWHRMKGREAVKKAGFKPIKLGAKEALSLINGTPFSSALAIFALKMGEELLFLSDIALALSVEALASNISFLFEGIHRLRKIDGQRERAKWVRKLIDGSQMTGKSNEVQAPYSVRCYPQVAGASTEALSFARRLLEGEVNSVTDNPLVFQEGVFSGGNFHAQPVALAADNVSMALAYLASISERRLFRLLDPNLNNGLSPFLVKEPGLNSGFMIIQYTAASLVAENRLLSHPAGLQSIPTSANQEDHVSMAPLSGRKAIKIAENTRYVLAAEIMAACQGMDLRGGRPGKGTFRAKEWVRKRVPFLEEDSPLSQYLETLARELNREFIEYVLGS